MTRRTRIKICGLTREVDVAAAVHHGADAIGMVLYPNSPRAISLQRAADLAVGIPPFVTPVLLMVNPDAAFVRDACKAVPHALLQFHGDDEVETPEFCASFERAYIKAARIPNDRNPTFDIVKYANTYASAQALLLDTWATGYGGSGHTFNWNAFNWSQLSTNVKPRLVLSGGLTPANVGLGINTIRPWAVDVSSGVEQSKGIKDVQKIQQFVHAVRMADEQS